MAVKRVLIDILRASFAEHADPVRAAPMQAYMKSTMPYHGIASDVWRNFVKNAVITHPGDHDPRSGRHHAPPVARRVPSRRALRGG
jgi:hypothetical protein